MNRRDILKWSGGVLGAGLSLGGVAHATAPQVRRLSMINLHTGETFSDAYWEHGAHVPDALAAINTVLRDHRSGEVHTIDTRLLDAMVDLRETLGAAAPYQIISGYRSPVTNAALHNASSGVATRSLHMQGMAIDLRVRGVQLSHLRDAAIAMGRGGVGYYEASDFVHIDTGRVRRW